MKNYYEILEVDIHASNEIIEKAFKVLAKKYHPDTQDEDKKQWAEEQFKLLNEAYEVLSCEEKRESYTKELEFDKNSQLNALLLKNADLEIQVEDLQLELDNLRNSAIHQQSINNNFETYRQTKQQAQEYIQNFNNYYTEPQTNPAEQFSQEETYYEAHYHPFKAKMKSLASLLITICIIILISFILWKIPYTHNILVDLYENNSIIHYIVNLFYM